jgi:hypothetical protein
MRIGKRRGWDRWIGWRELNRERRVGMGKECESGKEIKLKTKRRGTVTKRTGRNVIKKESEKREIFADNK